MNFKQFINEAKIEIVVNADDAKTTSKFFRDLGAELVKSGYKEGSAKYFFIVKAKFDIDKIKSMAKEINLNFLSIGDK